MNYKEIEKLVYDHLSSLHEQDPSFTFSVRQKGSKEARTDYFIGTEKSGYFGFTLWNIPVYFPGSSGDLTNYMLYIDKNKNWSIKFQCQTTHSPGDLQNEVDLTFVQRLEKKLIENLPNSFEVTSSKADNKMFYFDIRPIENSFLESSKLLIELDKLIKFTKPLIIDELQKLKTEQPEWTAGVITPNEFDSLIKKMHNRFEKYKDEKPERLITTTEEINLPESEKKSKSIYDPNIILYGPPGTGKTYYTVNYALSYIENKHVDFYQTEDRKEVLRRYNEYRKNGRIEFVTFHQSYGYEDFVEGIKPESTTDRKNVIYEVKDGVLKKIVENAKEALITKEKPQKGFDLIFQKLKDTFLESEKDEIEIPMKRVSFQIIGFSERSILFRKNSGGTGHNLSIRTLKEIFNDQREYDSGLSIYYHALIDFMKKKYASSNAKPIELKTPTSNYVLIIDEINRGNIANIFGELITLIEPSKREGQMEEISVNLPYSNDPFSIPENLYIIGTMNTADRSVEALDTALRRRFSFIEMAPKVNLITPVEDEQFTVNLHSLFSTINDRIEALLDKDHKIGHSYFMDIFEADDPAFQLKFIFAKKILPLLEEYFYGDPRSIGAILGSGFVEKKGYYKNFPVGYFPEEASDKELFKIKNPLEFKDLTPFISVYQNSQDESN